MKFFERIKHFGFFLKVKAELFQVGICMFFSFILRRKNTYWKKIGFAIFINLIKKLRKTDFMI